MIGLIFVAFSPTSKLYKQIHNLRALHQIHICVVDNGNGAQLCDRSLLDNSIIYIRNSNIGGIAGAFNRGVEELSNHGCTGFFTFDQDTEIPDNFLPQMLAFIRNKKAEIACPNFFDINSRTPATFVKLNNITYETGSFESTDFAISSGMYFSKEAYSCLGGFSPKYFIDHVDTDFCLRAKAKGIAIFVNYDVCLKHQIGNRTVHRFLGITLKPNHHSALRKYYIARNGTHLALIYAFKFPSYFFMNILRVGHETACVILYENNKLSKVHSILLGIFDSIRSKLGPRNR